LNIPVIAMLWLASVGAVPSFEPPPSWPLIIIWARSPPWPATGLLTAPGTWRGITPAAVGSARWSARARALPRTAWPPRQHWQAGCCRWRS